MSLSDEGEGVYVLKAAYPKTTATGKPFLSAVLADTSGTIEAKVWDYSGPIGERDTGKVLKVCGSVSDYRGMPQLTVDRLRLAEEGDPVGVARLVSVAPVARGAGYDEALPRSKISTTAPCASRCATATKRRSAPFPPPRAYITAFCPVF